MSHTILFSADPGTTGAIAEFRDGALHTVHDPVDASLARPLADLLVEAMGDPFNDVSIAIEKVNGMPGQSGPASFNFGKGFGAMLGVCLALGIEPTLVHSSVWKQAVGLRGLAKAASKDLAAATFPAFADRFLKWRPDKAEAALIGFWAMQQ
ncbi:hypothetical protein [Sphingomonas sp.]|uniref:hypothetical protein n=1 Tax=Sphingomonas sp. TaxID=28214 RepID=UPI00257AC3B6|nr:hypothetical protein [Sphingomonas sp.]